MPHVGRGIFRPGVGILVSVPEHRVSQAGSWRESLGPEVPHKWLLRMEMYPGILVEGPPVTPLDSSPFFSHRLEG
jgi:hypothetical protein